LTTLRLGTNDVLQRQRRSLAMRKLTDQEKQSNSEFCHFCPTLATLKVGEDVFCHAHAGPVLAQAIRHSVLRDRH